MKKIAYTVFCAALLTGCATYVPTVSNPPKNQSVLTADIAACEKEKDRRMAEASKKHQTDDVVMGAFGLLGTAVVYSGKNADDDYFKPPKQIIDECMTEKGYKIENQ